MAITVTAIMSGVLTLIYLGLSLRVSVLRMSNKTGIGYEERSQLHRAVRAHGNFSEYVPLMVFLVFLIELGGTFPPPWLAILGAVFVCARILHAVGLSKSAATSPTRFIGAGLSYLSLGIAGMAVLYIGLNHYGA